MYCTTTVLRRLSPYWLHDSLEIVLSATARNKAVMRHIKVLSCTANDSLLIFVQLKFWCTTALVGLLVRFPNTQHFVILYFVILPIRCCCCCCCYFIHAQRRTRSWFAKERYEYEQLRCTFGRRRASFVPADQEMSSLYKGCHGDSINGIADTTARGFRQSRCSNDCSNTVLVHTYTFCCEYSSS